MATSGTHGTLVCLSLDYVEVSASNQDGDYRDLQKTGLVSEPLRRAPCSLVYVSILLLYGAH